MYGRLKYTLRSSLALLMRAGVCVLLRGTRGVAAHGETAGDGNLRRNLKEISYTFTGITNAPLAIRVTARSRIVTLAHAKLRIRNIERIFIILSHLSV